NRTRESPCNVYPFTLWMYKSTVFDGEHMVKLIQRAAEANQKGRFFGRMERMGGRRDCKLRRKLRDSGENRYLAKKMPMETVVDASTIRRGTNADPAAVRRLNREIFGEDRLINTLDHDYLLLIVAERHGIPLDLKIGYRD